MSENQRFFKCHQKIVHWTKGEIPNFGSKTVVHLHLLLLLESHMVLQEVQPWGQPWEGALKKGNMSMKTNCIVHILILHEIYILLPIKISYLISPWEDLEESSAQRG